MLKEAALLLANAYQGRTGVMGCQAATAMLYNLKPYDPASLWAGAC
jgi:hypothetical protein